MQFFGKNIPCGCEARKEIMFETGGMGKTEAAIIAASVILVIAAWRMRNA